MRASWPCDPKASRLVQRTLVAYAPAEITESAVAGDVTVCVWSSAVPVKDGEVVVPRRQVETQKSQMPVELPALRVIWSVHVPDFGTVVLYSRR